MIMKRRMRLRRPCAASLLLVFFLALLQHEACADDEDTDIKTSCVAGPHEMPNRNPKPDPQAPEQYRVTWYTTANPQSPVVLEVTRAWSPLGADRFYQLAMDNYFTCGAFFRVVNNFVVQFGIASEPEESAKWDSEISDDEPQQSNTEGTVTFATSGADSRTTQIFVNLKDNKSLDSQGFTPFGVITAGMEVIKEIYNPTHLNSGGVDQTAYKKGGNEWILTEYPKIDIILSTNVEILEEVDTPEVHAGGPLFVQWAGCLVLVIAAVVVR